MKNFFFLVLGLLIILGSVFLFFSRPVVPESQTKIIKINDTSIQVEVVDTPQTRAKGLSGRKTLPAGTGMLFIFGNPVQDGFWMKDMRFAIDIVWIDNNFRVVDINKEVSPDTFPQIFYPNQVVQYVLELPAGFSARHFIDIGAMVQF
ncbi:MAG: DUF192 domain-containing protein [bacterium]|nr:DUF192 domain-containing protein [bacterium]